MQQDIEAEQELLLAGANITLICFTAACKGNNKPASCSVCCRAIEVSAVRGLTTLLAHCSFILLPSSLQLPSLNGLLQAQPDPNTPKTGPFLYVWAAYGKSCE